MAQTNNILKVRVDRIGRESTFGTLAGTMTPFFPTARPEIELTQEQLARTDERARPHAHVAPVQGYQSGTVPCSMNFRAPSVQLTDVASPPADTPTSLLMLEGALGGKSALAAGGTMTGTPSTSSLPLSTGNGANFNIGSLAIAFVAGVPNPVEVTNISTDTLTIWPNLGSAPASGQKVYNTYCYFPDTSIPSLSFDGAVVGDTSWQVQMTGCVVTGLELTIESGKLAMYKATAKVGGWTGPAALSLSTSQSADPDGSAFYINATASTGLNLLQPTSTTTRASVIVEKASIKVEPGNDHIPGIGGGVQGKVGVMRTDPKRPFGTISLQLRTDQSFASYYTNQTALCFWHATQLGTGTSARWFMVQCFFVLTKPIGAGGVDGERGVMMLEGELVEDPLASVNASTAQAVAPIRIAVG